MSSAIARLTAKPIEEGLTARGRAHRMFFAGGGTGGHLYPGLAIANEIQKQAPDVQPFFIGAQRGIEREVLPTTEFPHTLLNLHPLYRRSPLSNWRTLVGAVSSWRAIGRLARQQQPIAVVGTGGYAAGVALAWARANGVPTILHEPDSHPGLTTRQFAKGAAAIFLGFPEAESQLPVGKKSLVFSFGCPIVPPPLEAPTRLHARRAWGLPDDAFVVLVVGGSQGARALNECLAKWGRMLPENVAVIWATGKGQADAYLTYESATVRVRPYLSPIADAYAAADLAVTRAGAMTIAELCAWGIPAMLVPLPTAAQDHQTHNARAMAAAGAAIHMPQSEFTPESLDATVRELMSRPAVMMNMAQAAILRGHPNAAAEIAQQILSLVKP
ncbi:MAG: UDP-N-acetylglucosamine--N-acetylmuramyl-(pentapeptide) pyrophosphoryl-undecaprenol N-acetylglucosamine transferase [Phycisphaerae bacterium]|nr:UDP-N-acetylglucosamine--N-acetylmuramyl-(pentapeptide) pyrophosphoryl-undecaprenol N-acetylglucosamine transferase [Gemmatimonadaceae bacterium]